MNLKISTSFARCAPRALFLGCIAAAVFAACGLTSFAEEKSTLTPDALPEAPSSLLGDPGAWAPFRQVSSKPDVAKKYHRVIGADQRAVPLSSKDKLLLSLVTRTTLSSVASSAFSAGLGYWHDDVPHYGVNLPAYGERFGAAELKATSESILSYGVYASLFHDDPRYYVMGRREKIAKRAVYSATRVVITRNDDGDEVVNWPKLAGLASSAALTNAYYPERDRRFGRTATSVLSSIAVTAGVNELHEFLGDAVHLVFHRHQDDDQK